MTGINGVIDHMTKLKIDMAAVAEECGVKFSRCDSTWKGTHCYQVGNGCINAGFRSKKLAIENWFAGEFASPLGRILLKRYLSLVKPSRESDNEK